ncbi:hypothetical protein EX30DRAFT_338923 [Ascodesmis nigricans]|uniref:SGT1-domain-containing protein n=1 Tax=Ascodesmis nigricans TaxID=341454 RepID=A0A4S2N540_9PEZI|nr:hypothetical protein EX30DRAFT_338923 [Ascodesmis nigricans]
MLPTKLATDPFISSPFAGIPTRTLTSDALEYQFYALSPALTTPESRLAELQNVYETCLKLREEWCSDYIFHRGSPPSFYLSTAETSNDQLSSTSSPQPSKSHPSVTGHLEYGDAVDDEWFALSLLLAITQRHPNVYLLATDTSDGQFLLVEAAHALPRWLSPETAENRVWINQGKLYIIPGKKNEKISFPDALEFLGKLQDPGALTRDKAAEKEALQRCKGYPAKKKEMEHCSVVRIPRLVAAVFLEIPEAVAAAVDAFYVRDPVSLKCLSRPADKRKFPSEDWVTMSIRFSKVLYAQLRGQEWNIPKDAGFPPVPGLGTDVGRQVDIGVKLAAGFEMLLAKENRKLFQSPGIKRIIEKIEDLIGRDDAWRKYLPTDQEIAKQGMRNDSEEWLNIDFAEFEKELNRASDDAAGSVSGDATYSDAHTQEKMNLLVERFEKFLNDDKAGLDGAELDSDDDEDDEDDDDASDISFDEEEFSRLMREMMGMPPDQPLDSDIPLTSAKPRAGDNDRKLDDDEEAEIIKIQDSIGAELRAAGIIGSNPADTSSKGKGKARITDVTEEDNSGGDTDESDIDDKEEVEVDFELVKNMLESFKGQGGLAGPAGTLLAEMGIYLPRDEEMSGESRNGRGGPSSSSGPTK